MAWNKKGQGLSFNIIVVAVLALIALVVVLAIFSGNFGKFSKDLESCALKGGTCTQGSCEEGERELDAECPTQSKDICCVRVID